jgi:MATE family multidrug resistance protein
MLQELKSAAPGAITGEARQIVRLALPMMIAQVAQVATGFVDTVMAGRVSTDDLAAVSLGASIFITVYVT